VATLTHLHRSYSPKAAIGTAFARSQDKVKVRIIETPREKEVDGVRLDWFQRGEVRDVSPSIGSWLIAEGYAEPEMRQTSRTEHDSSDAIGPKDNQAH